MKKLLLGIILALAACTTIPPGTVGILVDNNAGGDTKAAMRIIPGPDMVWVGPLHTLYDFPVSVQQYTFTASPHEGGDNVHANVDESFQFQTVDGSVVHADLGITYHIDPSNVVGVFKKYRKDLDAIRNIYIRNTIREALNEVTGGVNVNDSIGPKRDTIIVEVSKRVTERLGRDGVTLDSLTMVGAFRPPQAVIDSLNAKLAATQNAMRVQNEVAQTVAEALKAKALAEGQAASQVARAKGEAESRRIQAEAEANANERIARSITPTLVHYKAIEKWNGQQPTVVGANTSLLLDAKELR